LTDTKIYYSIPEAAERLGMSTWKLRELIRKRKLSHYDFDGMIRISEDDVTNFEKKNHVLPAREKPF